MHIIFMPYGVRTRIEEFFREAEAQKFKFPLFNPETKETKKIWIYGGMRALPFGMYEYVFPKEYQDNVLTTFGFNKKTPYQLGQARMAILRRLVKAKKAPSDFDTSQNLLWNMQDISIIPIGIRYDKEDFVESQGQYKGWVHEEI